MIADSQGLFAALAPVPALPRERRRRRHALQELPRLRPRARHAPLPGEGARGREGRHADPAQGQGRGRPERRPAGDLFVRVEVEPSPLYERRGADLVLEVPVTYPEAALGATVEIPTPQGPVGLKVPSGSESGKLLRVKGRGAPKLKGGGKGDLLARLRVTVPKKLTKAEREALEAYQRRRASSRASTSRGRA